jgi:hypothetical protein
MAYYTCIEDSDYINVSTGMRISPKDAWDNIKSINEFEDDVVPSFSYNFDENRVRVRNKFME